LKLRLKGTKSIFEEIAEQYQNYIRLGVIPPGEKLPSCRELAIELGINPNTVERAYALLEAEGLVMTMHKKGTFVVEGGSKKTVVLAEAKKQVAALKNAGLSHGEILKIVERVYKAEGEEL